MLHLNDIDNFEPGDSNDVTYDLLKGGISSEIVYYYSIYQTLWVEFALHSVQ